MYRTFAADLPFHQRALRRAFLVLSGTLVLAVSAKVNLPLPYVPMTLQTLAVLMIGTLYGARLGVATVAAYLAEGAMGLPVFAGPLGGVAPLVGPTAGYLYGFVAAAAFAGAMSHTTGVVRLFAAMLIGHLVIVGCGFGWLAVQLGLTKAFAVGVAPFIAGSLIKSAIGAFALNHFSRRST